MRVSSIINVNSDALNVALNIGILTQDKLKFNSIKLGLKGERTVEPEQQKFKLFDTKTKKVIFSLILHDSSIKIIEFKRGAWEGLFEQYTKAYGKNKKDETGYKLKSRPRTRRPTSRVKD